MLLAQVGAAFGLTSGGGSPGVQAARRVGEHVHIRFVRPVNATGRFIDRTTGGLGVGHVVLDVGEADAADNLLCVDCHPDVGVHRRPILCYRNRILGSVQLDADAARFAYGAAMRRMGQPYHLKDADACSCATLVYRALPPPLRRKVEATPARGIAGNIVSPNRLAEAFGIVQGEPDAA